MCTDLEPPVTSQRLYTESLCTIIFRYAISEYYTAVVRHVDSHGRGGGTLGNSFNSRVDVHVDSHNYSDFCSGYQRR